MIKLKEEDTKKDIKLDLSELKFDNEYDELYDKANAFYAKYIPRDGEYCESDEEAEGLKRRKGTILKKKRISGLQAEDDELDDEE
jgi:hypothetical protein